MGSEKTNIDEALEIVKGLVNTTFLGEQHTVRINMISDYENSH
jgi:ribose 5-phosphate isomerase RpiB